MGRLDGKVAAVTGGASGIGEATVRRFVAEGASVAFCDRDGERGERVAAELETGGAKVAFTRADVGTEAACLDFVNGAAQKFGRLDLLINNAGIRKYEKVDEASAASWKEILDVNLMGVLHGIRSFLPHMRAHGQGGHIVNTASMAGMNSGLGFSPYSASKFALEGLSEALAPEMAPFGIKVLIVEPGYFRTNMTGSGRLMPELEPYRDVVGPTREFLRSIHGAQPGDPLKAGAAIEQALAASATPLRLQLGTDAVDAIRGHAQRLLEDLRVWEGVAAATRVEGP